MLRRLAQLASTLTLEVVDLVQLRQKTSIRWRASQTMRVRLTTRQTAALLEAIAQKPPTTTLFFAHQELNLELPTVKTKTAVLTAQPASGVRKAQLMKLDNALTAPTAHRGLSSMTSMAARPDQLQVVPLAQLMRAQVVQIAQLAHGVAKVSKRPLFAMTQIMSACKVKQSVATVTLEAILPMPLEHHLPLRVRVIHVMPVASALASVE